MDVNTQIDILAEACDIKPQDRHDFREAVKQVTGLVDSDQA